MMIMMMIMMMMMMMMMMMILDEDGGDDDGDFADVRVGIYNYCGSRMPRPHPHKPGPK